LAKKEPGDMKLVVGLGNPGRKYEQTRHNVGFEVMQELARRWAGGARPKNNFQAEMVDAVIGGERGVLLCPQTFMNRSGQSVVLARDFYKLGNRELLVVCDDFALPVGQLRCRTKGSSGGQKGLEDTIRALGTDEVPRLRIGIGPVPPAWIAADFVLSKFSAEERLGVDESVKRAADAVETWAKEGIAACMNRYN
jgi:PTH1 family peptidyl-tRNA hydrolase